MSQRRLLSSTMMPVFVAASIVAFGPALVLDYVPARKVDVYDKADAASAAGKTQRLLLAFAGGGLMAEAALHLLPHLFAPHHGHGHGHEGEHHDEQGFVDTFMLIAAGFLATFAIDRFGGRKADDFSPRHGGVHVSKGVDVKAPVAAASDVAEATTAETKEVKAGVEDTTEPAAAEHPSPQEKQDEAPEMTTVAKSDEVPEEAPGTSSKEAEPTTPAADTPTEVPEVVEDTTQSATDALAKNLPAADAVATDAPDAELPADDPQEIEASVTEPTAADAQETKPPASEPSASDPPASDPPASDPPATDTPAADTPAMVPPATDSPAETTDAKADGIDVGVITKGAEGDEPDMDAAPATEADPPTPATEATEEGTPDATKPEGGAGDDGIEDADADAAALPKADPDPAEPELTLYGNPKTPLEAEAPAAEAKTTEERTEDTAARELKDDVPKEDEKKMERAEADGAGHHGGDGDDHHHDDHGEAGGGAYATLAVDVLHNMIDGFGIGTAYVFQGTSAGHMTALLKLIHELQHEVGDVATLVQHGMSKHHAIHVQHTTAAGVFLGLAISLTAGAFPSGLLSVLLALSAGATFQLASGTILGPVLAIPAGVGGARHAFLELLAMTAGAGGVVAIGAAEKMVGLGH